MKHDFNACINTAEKHSLVFIDKFNEGSIWLNVQISCGNAGCLLTLDQARQMIEALENILTHKESV